MSDDGYRWYKRKPAKFIRGVRGLGPDVIGCYSVVLDLIYEDEDSCPNDPAWIGGILGCSSRKARSLIARLLDVGKLELNSAGRLVNRVAATEIETRAKHQRTARETGAKGGRISAEKRSARNKNKDIAKGTLNHLEENREEKKQTGSLRSPVSPEAATPPSVVAIPLIGGMEFPVTQKIIDEFVAAYPAVDVLQELRAMRAWALSNPTKKKTAIGVMRFINTWLSKAQDNGGRGLAVAQPKYAPPVATIIRISDHIEEAKQA